MVRLSSSVPPDNESTHTSGGNGNPSSPKHENEVAFRSTITCTTSRDSLRQQVDLRRASLTVQEFSFLTDLAKSGSEMEVSLAARRLSDKSLFSIESKDELDGKDDDLQADPQDFATTAVATTTITTFTQEAERSSRRLESLEERRQSQSHGRIWKAHENGLAVTQKSSRKSFLQREQSVSALSSNKTQRRSSLLHNGGNHPQPSFTTTTTTFSTSTTMTAAAGRSRRQSTTTSFTGQPRFGRSSTTGRIPKRKTLANGFQLQHGSTTRRTSFLLRQASQSRLSIKSTNVHKVPKLEDSSYSEDISCEDSEDGDFLTSSDPGIFPNKVKPPAFGRMTSGPAKLSSSSSAAAAATVVTPPPIPPPMTTLRRRRTSPDPAVAAAAAAAAEAASMISSSVSILRRNTMPHRRASTGGMMSSIAEEGIRDESVHNSPSRGDNDDDGVDAGADADDNDVGIADVDDVSWSPMEDSSRHEPQAGAFVSVWDGTSFSEEKEDKKMSEEDLAKDLLHNESIHHSRKSCWKDTLEIRRASVGGGGEGMEISAMLDNFMQEEPDAMSESETFDYDDDHDDDDEEQALVSRQALFEQQRLLEEEHAIVMRRASINVYQGQGMEISDWDAQESLDERRENLESLHRRQDEDTIGHHRTSSSYLEEAKDIPFNMNIRISVSFDETQSQDRLDSLPKAGKDAFMIYRSVSEDELTSFLVAHQCKYRQRNL